MDLTPFVSQFVSLLCHVVLISWLCWDHVVTPELPEETSIVEKTEKEIPAPKTIKQQKAVKITAPMQESQALAAMAQRSLPHLADDQLYEKTIFKPISKQQSEEQGQSKNHKQKLTLPSIQIDVDATLSLALKKREDKATSSIDQHANDIHYFTHAINIIIGHHYRNTWKKHVHKRLGNHRLELLVTTKDSMIIKAEIIRGSGVSSFDATLIRWIEKQKPTGSPVPDGQYPIVLILK